MAKPQKLSQLLIGKEVALNFNLCDISGEPHPAAGKRATVIARNSKTAYQVGAEDGAVYVVQESDWTPYPNKLHPDTMDLTDHRKTINLYTDAKLNKVEQLLLGTIHESPFNPRTNYPAEEMEELAESAREVGIMQPVLVRPRGDGGYELVFGHRRHRAALTAKLEFIPAIVRDLTDAQSAQLQAVENVQRRDLDPMDEALGYAAFIAAHGITKDELARQIGKSRTHVYNRLKLATLHAPGQAALRAGKIRAEVATRVARVVGEKNQAKALALMLEPGYGGELKSLRAARSELSEKFTLDLKAALWALDDAGLVASAGACTVCPKRSGVDPIVYADLLDKPDYYSNSPKGQNVCTDPDCFAGKKTAQLKRNQEALEAKGKIMVTGNAARKAVDAQGNVKGDYIPVSEMREALKSANKGTAGPAVTTLTIQNPRDGKTIEVVKRKEAEAAGVKTPPAKPANGRTDWNAYERDRKEEEKAREAKAAEQTRINVAALHKVRETAARVGTGLFELRMIAQVTIAGVAYVDKGVLLALYDAEDTDDLKDKAGRMSKEELTTLLLDCALVDNVRMLGYGKPEAPEPMLAAAMQYGVDVEAVRQAYTPAEVTA
ncbi:ParB/RepB/Spo0J family partition protein [Polaromonas naphthalenivorans]|uniref:ParB-like partition protein n=1 Tax=Polaromonas naphthalenivorans (strain CJ2) TaxID=365044 RepID=A1VPK5_POLNA|nr:ParB/RepB/Spo0J family partition protein [Polaromonas naphthalenivorans]ABM37583.1 parB-like partition protein [Polaromonas naphthalenivorans CJ2]